MSVRKLVSPKFKHSSIFFNFSCNLPKFYMGGLRLHPINEHRQIDWAKAQTFCWNSSELNESTFTDEWRWIQDSKHIGYHELETTEWGEWFGTIELQAQIKGLAARNGLSATNWFFHLAREGWGDIIDSSLALFVQSDETHISEFHNTEICVALREVGSSENSNR